MRIFNLHKVDFTRIAGLRKERYHRSLGNHTGHSTEQAQAQGEHESRQEPALPLVGLSTSCLFHQRLN